MLKRIVCCFLLILYLLFTVPACSAKDAPAASDRKFKVVIMPKLIGTPYFNQAEEGAKQAGRDLNMDITYTEPTKVDAAEQVKILEDLISTGVDCIAVAPNDPAALTPVLKKAKDRGILVMDWDTPANSDLVELSIRAVDDREFARHIWDLLVRHMGTDDADYAIVTGGLSAANLNSWIDYGLEYAGEKYPGLRLVTEKIPTDEKVQLSYQKSMELIKAYPHLKGIVGISVYAAHGAAQAVYEKGLQDKITVAGCVLPIDSKAYIKNGAFDGATGWDPTKLGYLTVYMAKQKLEGKKPVNKQVVPLIGEITVRPNGKDIIMGPPMDYTMDNVD